jgi:predicted small lipoprotein YifL
MIFFILILFFSAGCGRKGSLIAPEDVHSKERSQPQGNESSAPGPQQGSQEESNDY